MAILTGTLAADFESFYAAAQKAEASLKGFEGGAGKVESSLNRMVDSFSGRKIISDATLMAEAVERIGGVSNLTERELARVGVTANEAAAKMKAMGIDVPPGLQKIADETKGAGQAQSALLGTVKDLALGFAAMFTARAAFNFAADVIQQAGALKDLSQQTHINVEDLQVLSGAMKEFGVDADALGKGLFTLSRKIAGGDDSVTRGLALMGMSLKDVDGLEGEALFLKIEHGLSTLQGGLRDTAASDLFGSKLGMAMAGASDGIDGAVDAARRMNTVMSGDAVDALDRYGEAVDRAKASLAGMAANMMGPLAEGFNTITDAAGRGATKWSIFVAMAKDFAASNSVTGASTKYLATLLDEVNRKGDEAAASTQKQAGAHVEVTAALTARQQATRFLATLDADSGSSLDAWQLKSLAHLKEIGQLNAQNAAGLGVNSAEFAKYTAEAAKAEAASKAAATEAKKYADALTEINSAGDGWRGTLATINTEVIEHMRGLTAAGVSLGALATHYNLTATQGAAFTAMLKDEAEAAKVEAGQVTATAGLWAEYHKAVQAGSHDTTATQIENVWLAANAQILAMDKAKTITIADYAIIAATATQSAANILQSTLESDVHSHAHFLKLADDAQIAYDFATAHATEYSTSWIQQLRESATAAKATADSWGQSFDVALDQIATHTVATLQKVTLSWSEAMAASRAGAGSLSGTIANAPLTEASKAATQKAYDEHSYYGPVVNGGQNTPRGTGPDFAALGYRAGGGPVASGMPYMVGEAGPELFTPGANGSITPNGGGAPSVVNHFYVNGTGQDVARIVLAEITRSMKTGRKWPSA